MDVVCFNSDHQVWPSVSSTGHFAAEFLKRFLSSEPGNSQQSTTF